MYTVAPEKITYCYSLWQPSFNEFARRGVVFQEGLPSLDQFSGLQDEVVVIDDLADKATGETESFFTRGSHHKNLSVILLTQNIFEKRLRTISLNGHYFIFCKSPRSTQQFEFFVQQIYGRDYKFAMEAYKDAMSENYGSLLVDLYPTTPECLRLHVNYLCGPQTYAYVNKK